jgi:hypothetical protein
MRWWLGVVLVVVAGCDSGGHHLAAGGGAGGMGGSVEPGGKAPPPSAGSPPLEPPASAGGDTSDLGSSGSYAPRLCGGQQAKRQHVSVDEARARGFRVDAVLERLEGVFEADARWDQPFADPQTRVRIEIMSDGTATIDGWDCGLDDEEGTPCDTDSVIELNLRVSVATADGRLQESFIRATGLDIVRGGSDGEVLVYAHSDYSELVGMQSLDPAFGMQSLDPARPEFHGDIRVYVLTAGDSEPRVQVHVDLSTPIDAGTNTRFDLRPLDGCFVWQDFVPAGAGSSCTAAPFGAGFCCGDFPTRFVDDPSYPIKLGRDSSCVRDADNDAGTEADMDGGGN